MKVLSIGRSQENDIVLNDPGVSKHHAQLIVDGNWQATIIDLGSTNGTFVNGQQIKGPRPLNRMDVIKLGSAFFKWQAYLDESSAENSAPMDRGPARQSAPAPVQEQAQPPVSPPMQQVPSSGTIPVAQPMHRNRWPVWPWVIFSLLLVGAIVGISFMASGGLSSLTNLPDTHDLQVDCSDVENLLIASKVAMVVTNTGSRTHDNVQIEVSGFDKRGDNVIVKRIDFEWALEPHGSLPKIVTLPAKVRSCECKVLDSNPR